MLDFHIGANDQGRPVMSGRSEVLFLIDEASAAIGSLSALEEALVRGRSAGCGCCWPTRVIRR